MGFLFCWEGGCWGGVGWEGKGRGGEGWRDGVAVWEWVWEEPFIDVDVAVGGWR